MSQYSNTIFRICGMNATCPLDGLDTNEPRSSCLLAGSGSLILEASRRKVKADSCTSFHQRPKFTCLDRRVKSIRAHIRSISPWLEQLVPPQLRRNNQNPLQLPHQRFQKPTRRGNVGPLWRMMNPPVNVEKASPRTRMKRLTTSKWRTTRDKRRSSLSSRVLVTSLSLRTMLLESWTFSKRTSLHGLRISMLTCSSIDTQGLLDRVFPLSAESWNTDAFESGSYSFRTLLQHCSQYPLAVLRVSLMFNTALKLS